MNSSLSVTTPTHSHCPCLGVAVVGVEWTLPNAGRKPEIPSNVSLFFSLQPNLSRPSTSMADLDSCSPHTSSCFSLTPSPSRLPLHPWLSYLLNFPEGTIKCGPAWASHLLRMSPLRHSSSPTHSTKPNSGGEYSFVLQAAWTFYDHLF